MVRVQRRLNQDFVAANIPANDTHEKHFARHSLVVEFEKTNVFLECLGTSECEKTKIPVRYPRTLESEKKKIPV